MFILIATLFLSNIIFICLWQLSVQGNLDKLGVKKTQGIFKVSPWIKARLSEYCLALCIFLLDLIILYLIFY
jgi:hypothetical protein